MKVQRVFSILSIIATIGVSIYILNRIQTDGILRLDFGGWLPPYGILFVADSFSMLLVVTTAIVTGILLLYAFSSIGKAHENMFFYPFVFFLIAGVNGSFLTGDLFNLFVCFEVMLYLLMCSLRLEAGKSNLLNQLNMYRSMSCLHGFSFLASRIYTARSARLIWRIYRYVLQKWDKGRY